MAAHKWTYLATYSVYENSLFPLPGSRKTCNCSRIHSTYQSLFPCRSLLPVVAPEGAAGAAWARCLSCSSFCLLASRSALSLAICCLTASLWARSLALSSLIWFTMSCACLSSRSRLALLSSCPWWRLSNSFFLTSWDESILFHLAC